MVRNRIIALAAAPLIALTLGWGAARAQCTTAAPGRCSQAECSSRHSAQVSACSGISGSPYAYFCTSSTHRSQRSVSLQKDIACLRARRYTAQCFDRIDRGHRHQIATLKQAIPTCGGAVPANPYDSSRP